MTTQDNYFKSQARIFTIILLIIIVILVELAPEITVSISTTNIRKFWNCFYFGSMSIYFILEAIVGNPLEINRIYYIILIELEYLSYFGKYKIT